MKRRTLLKSALGALTLGLLAKPSPTEEWVDEPIARVPKHPRDSKGRFIPNTVVLGEYEWSVSGNNWTLKKLNG